MRAKKRKEFSPALRTSSRRSKITSGPTYICRIKVNNKVFSKKIHGIVPGHPITSTSPSNWIPEKVPSSNQLPVKISTKLNSIPDKVLSSSKPSIVVSSPFSSDTERIVRPSPQECLYVTESLAKLHPHVVEKNDDRRKTLLESCGMRDSITEAVVSTMLSQNTTDANSKAAFKNLKATFFSNPNINGWETIANLDDISKLESAIKVAGLAKTRSERIVSMLQIVQSERGTPSLEYLRDITSDDEVKKELGRFKGLGPKTISCVLLFALGRNEFPVDTHVLRITSKMGWLPNSNMSREGAYDYLNKVVPNPLKLDLHCLLVTHGKHCHACASRGRPQFPPKDGSKLICPLGKVSSWGGILPKDIFTAYASSMVKIEEATNINKEVHVKQEMNEVVVKKEEIENDDDDKVRAEDEPSIAIKCENY